MKIDLFSIGKFTIHGYGLMIAIGILCCVAMASYRAKKNGLDQEAIVDIGIYGVIGGFLGAKILYVIVEFKTFIKDPKTVLRFRRVCRIWWNYCRFSDSNCILQNQEALFSGIF